MSTISDSQKKWALTATILGSSMAFINGSVVNVALPAIQAALNATVADMQWVMSIYAFMLGTLILTGGSAGDYYGRKRVFGLGVFIFLVTTIWCGLAPDVQQLIFGRAGQALGGALMIPGSLAIITDLYDENERGRAIGIWSGLTALSTAIGPLLGGILVDQFSWRFIFLISVPLALAALVILFWRVPESSAANQSQEPDWKGALLATLGLGLVCYGLIEASEKGISNPVVLVSLSVGVIVFTGFIWLEKRIDNPMVPPELFRSKTFSGANLVSGCFFFSMAGVFFLFPFNVIQVQDYSATAAGAAFIPFPLLVGGLSRWSGGLIVRYGARNLVVVGSVLTSVGFVLLGFLGTDSFYWTSFFPGILFLGLGMAFAFAPLNTTVMGAVDQSDAGTASGVNKAVTRLSGMLSVALLGALAISIFGSQLSGMMRQSDIPKKVQRQMMAKKTKLAKAEIPKNVAHKTQKVLQKSIRKSFLSSFSIMMYISAGLMLVGALCSALMIDYQPESTDELREEGV